MHVPRKFLANIIHALNTHYSLTSKTKLEAGTPQIKVNKLAPWIIEKPFTAVAYAARGNGCTIWSN